MLSNSKFGGGQSTTAMYMPGERDVASGVKRLGRVRYCQDGNGMYRNFDLHICLCKIQVT